MSVDFDMNLAIHLKNIDFEKRETNHGRHRMLRNLLPSIEQTAQYLMKTFTNQRHYHVGKQIMRIRLSTFCLNPHSSAKYWRGVIIFFST